LAAGDASKVMKDTRRLRRRQPASSSTLKLVVISGPRKAGKKTVAARICEHDKDRWQVVLTDCDSETLSRQQQAISTALRGGSNVIAVGRNLEAAHRRAIFKAADSVDAAVIPMSVCVCPHAGIFHKRGAPDGWQKELELCKGPQAPHTVDAKIPDSDDSDGAQPCQHPRPLALPMKWQPGTQAWAVGLIVHGTAAEAVRWFCAPHMVKERVTTALGTSRLAEALLEQLPLWRGCAADHIRSVLVMQLHVEHVARHLELKQGTSAFLCVPRCRQLC